jgi:transposase
MIQLTPQMRILVAIEPVDFRNGVDGLGRVCRQVLQADPMGGAVFVFCNRRRTAIKVLVYDGQGYWVCLKRLSAGRFRWWPSAAAEHPASRLDVHELQLLLWNADPTQAKAAPAWRPLPLVG